MSARLISQSITPLKKMSRDCDKSMCFLRAMPEFICICSVRSCEYELPVAFFTATLNFLRDKLATLPKNISEDEGCGDLMCGLRVDAQ
jgi:hypothetical protein